MGQVPRRSAEDVAAAQLATQQEINRRSQGQNGIVQLRGGVNQMTAPAPAAPAPVMTTSYGGSSSSGGGSAVAGGAGGGAINTATPDANLSDMTRLFKERLAKLQQRPGMDQAFTDKAISQARGSIADRSAGEQEALTARLASRGVVGGGTEGAERSRIDDAARRLGARTGGDIALARVRDEEQMGLSRDNMENQFLLGGQSAMSAPSQLALQQQQLGLQQALGFGNLDLGRANLDLNRENAAAGRQDSQQSMMMALARMYPQLFGM